MKSTKPRGARQGPPSRPSPASGPFRLIRVDHHPDRRPALSALVEFAGQILIIAVRAADLTTFARFRSRVAEQFGVWIDYETHPRQVARYWSEDVEAAFAAREVATCPGQ